MFNPNVGNSPCRILSVPQNNVMDLNNVMELCGGWKALFKSNDVVFSKRILYTWIILP
jgi:hypothetical protein